MSNVNRNSVGGSSNPIVVADGDVFANGASPALKNTFFINARNNISRWSSDTTDEEKRNVLFKRVKIGANYYWKQLH